MWGAGCEEEESGASLSLLTCRMGAWGRYRTQHNHSFKCLLSICSVPGPRAGIHWGGETRALASLEKERC